MYDEWFMVSYENNIVPNKWLQEAEQATLAKRLPRTGARNALVDGQVAHFRAGFSQLATTAGRTRAAVRSWITRSPAPKEQCC